MLLAAATISLIAAIVMAWFVRRPPTAAQFEARVHHRLRELGLKIESLDAAARARLNVECKAVYGAAKRFDPRRLAMRFFTWCITRQPFAHAALREGASVTNSILTLRKWQEQDRSLQSLAQKDIEELTRFLCEELDRSALPKDEVLAAQAELLALAAGKAITDRDLEKIADEIVAEHRNAVR